MLVTHSRASGFRRGVFIPSVDSCRSATGAQPKKKEMNRTRMVKTKFLGIIELGIYLGNSVYRIWRFLASN